MGACRHFDKLTKEEQVAVLKDALGRKERLEKLEGMSEKFDDTSVAPHPPLQSVRARWQHAVAARV